MSKRTEGPWKVSKLDGRTINGKAYRNLEGNLVTPAIASIKERTGETDANARLIAAAAEGKPMNKVILELITRYVGKNDERKNSQQTQG